MAISKEVIDSYLSRENASEDHLSLNFPNLYNMCRDVRNAVVKYDFNDLFKRADAVFFCGVIGDASERLHSSRMRHWKGVSGVHAAQPHSFLILFHERS